MQLPFEFSVEQNNNRLMYRCRRKSEMKIKCLNENRKIIKKNLEAQTNKKNRMNGISDAKCLVVFRNEAAPQVCVAVCVVVGNRL